MTARQGDWSLVGYDSDPVPQTPSDIHHEADIYTGFAELLQDQIDALNELSNPDERLLVGEYADKIQDASRDLADHLGKIKGRFEDVGGHLTSWAETVAETRRVTGAALDAAERERASQSADDDAEPLLPGQVDPVMKPHVDRAHGAMNDFDAEAGRIAQHIRDASDDDMKDSRWDKFKDWVSGFADVLDLICDVLGWIAAAIVIALIIFSGPAGWLVFAAILGGIALAGHTLLAATGNGSWVDVAFDAISLVTMGLGGRALKGAQAAREVTLAQAGRQASSEAYEQVMTRGLLNGGEGVLGRAHVGLRSLNPFRVARADRAASAAENLWVTRGLPPTSVLDRAAVGGDEVLGAMRNELPVLQQLLGEGVDAGLSTGLNQATRYAQVGTASDAISLLTNPKLGEHELYNLHGGLDDALTFTIGGPY